MSDYTPGTATKPATSTFYKNEWQLPTSDAKKELSGIAEEHKRLMKLQKKYGDLKKDERLKFPDGTVLTAQDIREMSRQHVKRIKNFIKNYTEYGKKKRKSGEAEPTKTKRGGFKTSPVVIDDSLMTFLTNGNFGYATPGNPSSGRLVDRLELLKNRVTTRGILTPLLNIYVRVNNLKYKDPVSGKTLIRADPLMRQTLGTTLMQLQQQDAAKSEAEMLDKKGNPKPRFNADGFVHNRLQNIVTENTKSKSELTPQQQAQLEAADVKARIALEQNIVSAANDALKAME